MAERGRPRANLIGKRFGKLVVIGDSEKRTHAICKCDCGKIVEVRRGNLVNGITNSCGCLRRENCRKVGGRELIWKDDGRAGANKKYGTHYGSIIKSEPLSNNVASNHVGVCYSNKRQCYLAYITINRTNHFLGSFKTYDDALNARLLGEEKYFKPVIDAMSEELDEGGMVA